jgi:hypothetical protein
VESLAHYPFFTSFDKLIWHRHVFYDYLDRITNFVFPYSIRAKLEYAFVQEVCLVLAKLGPHHVVDRSD